MRTLAECGFNNSIRIVTSVGGIVEFIYSSSTVWSSK